MDKMSPEMLALLSSSVFQGVLNNNTLKIQQLCLIINLLIKFKIPFDISFSPGTRRVAPAAQLTLYINPTTTLQFVISLDGGDTIFGGTPT